MTGNETETIENKCSLTFGAAIELLKQGKKIKRRDWGGYWFMPLNSPITGADGENQFFQMNQTIVARLKEGGGYVVATPYQADILAEDWELVNE